MAVRQMPRRIAATQLGFPIRTLRGAAEVLRENRITNRLEQHAFLPSTQVAHPGHGIDLDLPQLRPINSRVPPTFANRMGPPTPSASSSPSLQFSSSRYKALQSGVDRGISEVQSLSRQRLEEIRSLVNPPLVVRRALAMVYFLLHPSEAHACDTLDDVSWKLKLVPMLRRDDFIPRLLAFAPEGADHPLVLQPDLCSKLERYVQVETPDGRTCRSFSSGNIANTGIRKNVVAIRTGGNLLGQSQSEPQLGEFGRHSSITRRPRDLVNAERLSFQAVAFASEAVGTLFNWVLSHLRRAKTLREIHGTAINQRCHSPKLVTGECRSPLARILESTTSSVSSPEPPKLFPLSIFFAPDSSALSACAEQVLKEASSFLCAHDDARLRVVGYSRSNEADQIATDRAFVVLESLVSHGIAKDRLRPAVYHSVMGADPQDSPGLAELRLGRF